MHIWCVNIVSCDVNLVLITLNTSGLSGVKCACYQNKMKIRQLNCSRLLKMEKSVQVYLQKIFLLFISSSTPTKMGHSLGVTVKLIIHLDIYRISANYHSKSFYHLLWSWLSNQVEYKTIYLNRTLKTKANIQMFVWFEFTVESFGAGDAVCLCPGLLKKRSFFSLNHFGGEPSVWVTAIFSLFIQPCNLVSGSRSSHSAFLVRDVVPSTWYLVFLWLQHCFDQSSAGAWVSNPSKPILATLCLAHWHSDPMPLRLWTQILEKPYRFFKHIISGWGFKNITNHLKVLVQCGSIILVLGKKFPGKCIMPANETIETSSKVIICCQKNKEIYFFY